MKKDRNCGCGMNNYPDYQMMPYNMGMGPNMMMNPNMGMNQNMMGYPGNVTNINTNDDEVNRLEQRVNMLERRVAALEGNNNYGSYSSNSYQML